MVGNTIGEAVSRGATCGSFTAMPLTQNEDVMDLLLWKTASFADEKLTMKLVCPIFLSGTEDM